MGIARTFAKNTLFQSGANIAVKLASLFLVVYLTVLLSPYDYGIYAWVISIALLLEVFADFGTVSSMIKFLSEAMAKKQNNIAAACFKYLFKLRLIALAIIALVLFFFSDFISAFAFNKPFLSIPLKFSALFLVCYSLPTYFQNLFVALKKNEYIFYSSILQSVLKVGLMVGLVLFMNSFFGALIGYAAAMIATFLFFVFVVFKKYRFLFSMNAKIEKKRLFRFAKYAALSSFALIVFSSIDILMISALLPIENVGFYQIAMSWAVAAVALAPIFLVYPIFSELHAKPKQHLNDAFNYFFKYFLFFFVPMSFGLAFISNPLIVLLYSSAYEIAVPPILFVLSFLVFLSSIASLLVLLFNSIERPDISAKVFFAALVINVILTYFFIKSFGIIGAAYAIIISYIFVLASLLILLKPFAEIKPNLIHLIKPLFASAVMFFVLITANNLKSVDLNSP